MKKRIRLNNDKIKKLVKERLRRDGALIQETKIDKALKRYLSERDEILDDEEPLDSTMDFSDDAKEAFSDMVEGINEMIEDLRIIQTKESDIIVDTYPQDEYSEEYLEELIMALESAVQGLEYIQDLSNNMTEFE